MKLLNGSELAGFIKERQVHQVRSLKTKPHLLIIRDSDNPVILKYVGLKKRYGEDIGVEVEEFYSNDYNKITDKIKQANQNDKVTGIIIQLPLVDKSKTDELCNLISPSKDVDGLGKNPKFDSATATAIIWLLSGYGIELKGKKIAIVGRGKLVGAPLYKMFTDSDYDVELFHRGSESTKLKQYDIIITATGVPGLISDSMVGPGAVIVDAGPASEGGVLKGDVADQVRELNNLTAITPITGGVGPLTISALFDHVICSAE